MTTNVSGYGYKEAGRTYEDKMRKQGRKDIGEHGRKPEMAANLLDRVQDGLREWGGPFAFQFDHHFMVTDDSCR